MPLFMSFHERFKDKIDRLNKKGIFRVHSSNAIGKHKIPKSKLHDFPYAPINFFNFSENKRINSQFSDQKSRKILKKSSKSFLEEGKLPKLNSMRSLSPNLLPILFHQNTKILENLNITSLNKKNHKSSKSVLIIQQKNQGEILESEIGLKKRLNHLRTESKRCKAARSNRIRMKVSNLII